MCNRGLGLSPTQLKTKVYEIIKTRWTPFFNGIPGGSWNLDAMVEKLAYVLLLWSSQALEAARASGLCEKKC